MVDMTDNWWDTAPPVWYGPEPANKTEYRILRAAKTPVPGTPGFIIQWKIYTAYNSLTQRDSAIKKLSNEHPKWRLKTSEGNPYLEALGLGGSPLPTSGINKT